MTRLLDYHPMMARLAVRLLLALGLAGGIAVGCKTDTTEIPGEKCVGGFVRPETGACEALCDETKCKEGNRCVDNRCSLVCDEQRDCADQPVCNDTGKCYLEAFKCAAATTDTDEAVRACVSIGARHGPVAAGYKCPLSWTQCFDLYCPYDPAIGKSLRCDPFACGGNPSACTPSGDPNVGTCPGGEPCAPMNCAATECKSSLFCPNGLQCDFGPCGGNFGACKKNCSGEDCNVGVCDGTGDPCIFTTCAPEHCKPLTCLTIGEGDGNAYCAQVDCGADVEGTLTPDDGACPGGYYCGAARDRHDLCGPTCAGTCSGGINEGNTCSADGDCQKGNDPLCGEVFPGDDATCIDPALRNTTNGASFFEGGRCLLRHTCLERNSCAPCESNVDCTVGDANACIDLFGQKSCARFCTDSADCTDDHYCAAYIALTGETGTCENAPAVDCTLADQCPDGAPCVGRSVCIPKSGPCRATPTAPAEERFCRHCIQDSDCGDAASGWACVEVTTGEFACLDLSNTTTCTSDANCPQTPDGVNGRCLDENVGVAPTDPNYHTCYAPVDLAEQKFTCYP